MPNGQWADGSATFFLHNKEVNVFWISSDTQSDRTRRFDVK